MGAVGRSYSGRRSQPYETGGNGHVVSRTLHSVVERGDVPLDAGFGMPFEGEGDSPELAEYKVRKLEAILRGKPLPPECEVVWPADVSYAGEGPEPRFERPGETGAVVYTQDNARPPEDRMVPSIEWRETGPGLPY